MGCIWGCFLLCWSLTYIRCHALMSTPVGAALFLVGAVTVIRAKFSTPSVAQAPARTHSWLYWKKREISIDKEIERESVVHGPFDWKKPFRQLRLERKKQKSITDQPCQMRHELWFWVVTNLVAKQTSTRISKRIRKQSDNGLKKFESKETCLLFCNKRSLKEQCQSALMRKMLKSMRKLSTSVCPCSLLAQNMYCCVQKYCTLVHSHMLSRPLRGCWVLVPVELQIKYGMYCGMNLLMLITC